MKIQQKPVDQRRARTKLGRSKYSALMAPHSVLAFTLCAIFFALCSPAAQAQQSKMYRVGILVRAKSGTRSSTGFESDSNSWDLKRENKFPLPSEIGRVMQRRS